MVQITKNCRGKVVRRSEQSKLEKISSHHQHKQPSDQQNKTKKKKRIALQRNIFSLCVMIKNGPSHTNDIHLRSV